MGTTKMIDKGTARLRVEQHISNQDLKGYSYKFAGVKSSELSPGEWTVVFDCYSPEGAHIDGPVVFMVDKVSGDIQIL